MNETSFDWDDLRLFLAVARAGGLSAAAAATGKSPPTLGRRMLALERRLGRELFRRLPRGYELTADGQDFLTKASAIEVQLHPIVVADPDRMTPVVKVSAGLWVTQYLCARASDIMRGDQIRLRFSAEDHLVDIGRREALIGIRNHRPDGPGLAGRKVAQVAFAVYARDETIGTWASVLGTTPSAQWVQAKAQHDPSIEVTSSRNALDLALSGAARAVLPTFIGNQYGDLQQLSDPIPELVHDQWLVTHHEDRFLPEVRMAIDRIAAILRAA